MIDLMEPCFTPVTLRYPSMKLDSRLTLLIDHRRMAVA